MVLTRVMYCCNILVAGWVGIVCLLMPAVAVSTVFTGSVLYSEVIKLVGALWLGIFALSIIGLFYPIAMQPIFVLQLFYKSLWLITVGFPAFNAGKPYPKAMAVFFMIWVLVLPFVIDWKSMIK